MKRSLKDYTVDYTISGLLLLLAFVTLYPFWNALVVSFNVGTDTSLGGVTFWPRIFTLDNYDQVFEDGRIIQAFGVTLLRTAVGTFLSIFFTAMFGYAMAKRGLIGKKYYMIVCVITMYFHGGLIPTYLVIRELHLFNTFWAMVLPPMINVFHMIIFRTFFQELPDGLEESAKIDGCNYLGVFFRIVIPLSGPVIATLSLFTALFHWNAWFDATIYITNQELMPIQTVLNQIINAVMAAQEMEYTYDSEAMLSVTHKSIVMATMVVATVPIITIYPFLQKYFVKGVLIGSLKG